MTDVKKSGRKTGILEKIRLANSEQHAASTENSERLDYRKGNLEQNRLKNAGVWEACPVLDETGKPME